MQLSILAVVGFIMHFKMFNSKTKKNSKTNVFPLILYVTRLISIILDKFAVYLE